MDLSIAHILQYFEYSHLPPKLQAVVRPFYDLAHRIASGVTPEGVDALEGPEAVVALRNLLEAKDAAIRAALWGGE